MLGTFMQRARSRRWRQLGRRLPAFRSFVEALEDRALLAPLVWYNGVNLPAPTANAAAVQFTDQSILLVGGGTTTVNRLLPGGTGWFTAASLDVARVSPGAVSTGEGNVLVYGGKTTQALNTALSYDPYGVNTQSAPSMGTARTKFAFASSGTDPYAIGGVNASGVVLSSVETFSSDTSSWNSAASLPQALYAASAAADGNGHIFVFGGITASGAISSAVYRYNIDADTWDKAASMPTAMCDSTAVEGPNGKIYVLGGSSNGTNALANVESYDPVANTWNTETSLPYAVKDAASVVDSEGRIEIVGGINSSGAAITTVDKTQRLNQPDAAPAITSTAPTKADPGFAYTYQVTATGNPDPFYSIVNGPAGMTVNKQSGLVTWTPLASSSGQSYTVDIRAGNSLGTVDQTYTLSSVDTTKPSVPTGVTVSSVTQTTITLKWTPSTDNVGVTSYDLYVVTTISGRGGSRTVYTRLVSGITSTSYTVTGLIPDSSHRYAVTALDAAGNQSGYSAVVTGKTTSLPIVNYVSNNGYDGYVSVVADFPLYLVLSAAGNPSTFTYSIVSGPTGMTINQSGNVSWTPKASQVGTTSATFAVQNATGTTDRTISITVTPDVPVLVVTINAPSGPSYGIVGTAMTLQVTDYSHQPSTFSIVSGPSGMTVNPTTGQVHWTPSPADAGTTSVTFGATNSAGSTNSTVSFITYASQAPTDVRVSSWSSGVPTVSWMAPANGVNITGYKVTANNTDYQPSPFNFDTHGTGTSIALTGLTAGLPYFVTVFPYDAAGNVGQSTYTYFYAFYANSPQVSWSFSQPQPVAGQPMTVQFADANTLPRTWAVGSGPTGMTINATTGLLSWTPGLANVSTDFNVTVTATNSSGTMYVTLDFPVYFSGQTTGVSATVSGNNANVSWTPPASNTSQIAGYLIDLSWVVNGVTYLSVFNSPGGGTKFSLPIPVLGGIQYHLSVVAYDGSGDLGAPDSQTFNFTGP
jgi:hypothetical protein